MFDIARVDTWTAMVEDRVGGLRDALVQLARAGVDLEVIIGRHAAKDATRSVLFVAPISGEAQEAAAMKAGFRRVESMHTLRLVGPDEPGTAMLVAGALAEEGISIRGVSAAALGNQFVMYLAFDSERDSARAAERLRRPV